MRLIDFKSLALLRVYFTALICLHTLKQAFNLLAVSNNLVVFDNFSQVIESLTEVPFCCSSIGPQKSIPNNTDFFCVIYA